MLCAAGGALQKLGPCWSPEENPRVHPLELCLCEQPVNLQRGHTSGVPPISGTSQATKNFPERSAAPVPKHFPTPLQCSIFDYFLCPFVFQASPCNQAPPVSVPCPWLGDCQKL